MSSVPFCTRKWRMHHPQEWGCPWGLCAVTRKGVGLVAVLDLPFPALQCSAAPGGVGPGLLLSREGAAGAPRGRGDAGTAPGGLGPGLLLREGAAGFQEGEVMRVCRAQKSQVDAGGLDPALKGVQPNSAVGLMGPQGPPGWLQGDLAGSWTLSQDWM